VTQGIGAGRYERSSERLHPLTDHIRAHGPGRLEVDEQPVDQVYQNTYNLQLSPPGRGYLPRHKPANYPKPECPIHKRAGRAIMQ